MPTNIIDDNNIQLTCEHCGTQEVIPIYAYENDAQNWGWYLYTSSECENWYCYDCDGDLLTLKLD